MRYYVIRRLGRRGEISKGDWKGMISEKGKLKECGVFEGKGREYMRSKDWLIVLNVND